MTTAVPSKLRKLASAKLAERKRNARRWAQESIKNYAEYLKAETEKLERLDETVDKEVEQFIDAMVKLKQAGFQVENPYGLELRVKTTKKRLTKLYHAIGRLDGSKASKYIQDPEKGLVVVTLPSVVYPDLDVSFIHKLSKTDKCYIEKVEVPAKTDYRLVCEKR